MNYSADQEEIFDAVQHGEGDIAINACAGSGKTTTLVGASGFLSTPRATFAAFNKPIAEELKEKLPGMNVGTLHSIGYALLKIYLGKRLRLVEGKYKVLARSYFGDLQQSRKDTFLQNGALDDFDELLSLARLTYTSQYDLNALHALALRYGLKLPDEFLTSVQNVLSLGEMEALATGILDYDDLLWLPLYWDMKPRNQNWLFIDEAQDLNRAMRDLVLRHRAQDGRILFVGDPSQAIYAFAGADSQSFDNILLQTGALELSLSVCYRCPGSHVQLAQTFVPHIQARPDAPDGEIAWYDEGKLASLLERDGSEKLVLCRTTAPLVSVCLKLIQSGVPARVRGQDVGKNLITITRSVAQAAERNGSSFGKALSAYESRQALRLAERPGPLATLHDKCAALRTIYETGHAQSASALQKQIASLFDDHLQHGVWLSTIHKAKGLEADSVYILRPEKLPLKWKGQQFWEAELIATKQNFMVESLKMTLKLLASS